MTSFVLKMIALIAMFCDHFSDSVIGHFSFLNLIGRFAFPIFAFQITEGYIHTQNVKKYFSRLLIGACISQIPFYLFIQKFLPTSATILNIFFTLLLGLFCIVVYDYFSKVDSQKLNGKILNIPFKNMIGIIFVFFISYIGELLKVDYGFWGIIVIFTFYIFKKDKLAMIISYICLCIIRYGYRIIFYGFHIQYVYFSIFTILAIIFISLYNGKQGYKIRYLLYIFYPLHLLLLYFLA